MLIRVEAEPGGFVTVTDDCTEAALALQRGEAVIGLQAEDSSGTSPWPAESWSGVSYFMTDLEALEDAWYVREAYCRFHQKPLVIEANERFVLREMTGADAPGILALYKEAQISRFLPAPGKDEAEVREKIREYIRYVYGYYGCGMWVLTEPATGAVIGRAGLEPETQQIPEGEISGFFLGYMIDARYRRQHLAEEACRTAIAFAWEHLYAEEIYCRISPENQPSLALAEKLGFVGLAEDIYILKNPEL